MENKDIVLILLVISVLYLLYCNNLKEKFSETPSSTTVTNTERSQVSITESIKNLGILANKIQENGDFTFPANLNVTGNLRTFGNLDVTGDLRIPTDNDRVMSVPIGTVIMWTMKTPPPPNTVSNAMKKGYEDDGIICWYPCVGGQVNGINIPDLRGRLVVGQGQTSGTSDNNHNFNNLGNTGGGNVPIRKHTHNLCFYNDNYDGSGGNESGDRGKKPLRGLENDCNGDGCHQTCMDTGDTRSTDHIMNYYNKNTTPYYSILQFWIRIR